LPFFSFTVAENSDNQPDAWSPRVSAMTSPVSKMQVQQLLIRVPQGDQAAAAEVFERYKRRLLGLARSEAED
jgi:hypothetical protein